MKKLIGIVLLTVMVAGLATAAQAVEFSFHGDMNHRFLLYTNRNDWLNPDQQGLINDNTIDDNYGEIKYRFWFEAGTNDNDVKGVYAVEIGGVRFGREGTGRSQGGSFSGDGVNVETRWAYLDFQLPFIESKARTRMGLMPVAVNSFFWQETSMGVTLDGALGVVDYQVGWIRGIDKLARGPGEEDIEDLDFFLGRLDCSAVEGMKAGVFALYANGDPDEDDPANFGDIDVRDYQIKQFGGDVDIDMWTLGLDGSYNFEQFFVNWDLMYQTGDIKHANFIYPLRLDTDSDVIGRSGNFDLSAYLLHADVGAKFGPAKLTYTFWYASGDDNPEDDDFEAFLSIDLDRDDSITLFEGLYPDDVTYFTERPYILDKGFVMNKLALDYQVTEKLTLGSAAMYMMTAEDIEWNDVNGNRKSDDSIGVEINGYLKYMLYKNVEFAINAGYLFADDALDAFEVGDIRDGDSDEDIWGSSMRVRYKF